MQTTIAISKSVQANKCAAFLVNKKTNLTKIGLTKQEVDYVTKKQKNKENYILINRLNSIIFIQFVEEFDKKTENEKLEGLRNAGYKITTAINTHNYTEVFISAEHEADTLAIAEGAALSNYQFLKYKSDKKQNCLEKIHVVGSTKKAVDELNILNAAVFAARDFVNEPVSYLNAVVFANEMKKLVKGTDINVEILNKKQLESLKMGGLLAVNLGSKTPPTFTILEYKPKNAKNKKPLVLVGKGVVYDTGGLSLKPTPNSMDHMKCDMAGGATAACSIYAIAKAELPYHVVALIPATDNRPGEIAYTPGDVITMFDGQTVEVLNTDAEGRMLLADALAYAKKYKPELVLDFATLTGAAAAAVGQYATVLMGTADEKTKTTLKEIGYQTHERLAEMPFWDDYATLIKSDIADMKNIGGPVGGAITAGKFLEKFVDYPWLHFDIAGPAYINSTDSYRPKNGTGVGVRLIFNFVKHLCNKK